MISKVFCVCINIGRGKEGRMIIIEERKLELNKTQQKKRTRREENNNNIAQDISLQTILR